MILSLVDSQPFVKLSWSNTNKFYTVEYRYDTVNFM